MEAGTLTFSEAEAALTSLPRSKAPVMGSVLIHVGGGWEAVGCCFRLLCSLLFMTGQVVQCTVLYVPGGVFTLLSRALF